MSTLKATPTNRRASGARAVFNMEGESGSGGMNMDFAAECRCDD
jgi:hypothetical protein